MAKESFSAAPGNMVATDALVAWLEINGFLRTGTVRDTGEYAVRGGIIDLYPPGLPNPIRLDFFGDTLESIRSFDPETQRTSGQLRKLALVAVTEFQVTPETIARFRKEYLAHFGAARRDDLLYEAVSEGRRHPGMEHWLPLFHERLETLFDYVPGASIVLEPLVDDAANERLTQIADYYEARKEPLDSAAPPYHPLPPDRLYLAEREWRGRLDDGAVARLTPFSQPDASSRTVEIGARQGRNFAAERAEPNANVYDAVRTHVLALQGAGKRVAIALWSEGARERMSHVLADHGLLNLTDVQSWPDALAKPKPDVALAVLGLESGFETDASAIISEQDILGDRLVRPRRASRRAEHFIAEVTSLTPGDLVVHVDHGIGRFAGLTNIEAAGAPHDCLEIHYAGGDKLFLPVENIELLSRYGSEETAVDLDRLGGAGWQNRKARMKSRIREIAGELIKVAAERQLREAPRLAVGPGVYDEFCAGFPYEETEDQRAAIDAVLDDLGAGRPMDRLVCGDVGFGKTEIALRAAAAAVFSGKQVAIVAPTTVLVRQHIRTFRRRFAPFGIEVAHLSRLASPAEVRKAKEDLASGDVRLVIGTHAIAGKGVEFHDLGLMVIDEEQRFGVRDKHKLRAKAKGVHVLTLSATPIPR
ncbi:MAG: DEAD/DEAH box helicase, partial [Microvirga sp.]